MQKSKKTLSLLITALLTISMIIAAVPLVSAALSATATPNSGPAGTVTTISGTGASAGGPVEFYWETLAGAQLNSTYADGTGAFSAKVTIPETTTGVHYVIVKDVSTGETLGVAFTVTPRITLAPTRGIPGDTVTVTGTGFNYTLPARNVTVIFTNGTYTAQVAAVNVTSSGSFSVNFTVPVVDYGDYNVTAISLAYTAINATAAFTVGAAITITPSSGPTGAVVSVTGRGFSKTANLPVTITVGGVTAAQVSPIKTNADGTFSGQIIIPTLSAGAKTVNASDGTYYATETYTVSTGKVSEIKLTPTSGPQGLTVNIVGNYFTAIAGKTVTVKFGALTVGTYSTLENGTFSGSFAVPSLPDGDYVVNATDVNGLTATANFKVAVTLLVVSPTSGPTGTLVTVTGYGFTASGTVNVTLGTQQVITNENVLPDKTFTKTFIVPTVPTGDYTVKATDSGGLSAQTTFTVTQTTTLVLTPSTTSRGLTVAVAADYFTATAGTALTFAIRNATWSSALTVTNASGWTGIATNATGSFRGSFNVSSAWALGTYTVNATDTNGLVAEATLTVAILSVTIKTGSTTYAQGDTVSFYVSSTAAASGSIIIKDPSGYIYNSITINTADWTMVPGGAVLPYSKTMFTLPADAAVGNWSWTATIADFIGSGKFAVIQKATLESLMTTIDQLNNKVNALNSSLASMTAQLNAINTAASNAASSASSAASAASAASSAANSAKSAADSAKASADSAVSAANAAKASADNAVSAANDAKNTAQSAVSAANAAKASADNAASAVEDAISAAEAAKAAAEGVSMAVWVAVVLSLVAAIAAIFAVITIRGKIAG
ncbi:MAG: beta strand repeat-containing protein [Candidatus Bathyarchaeales archaeon]